jgi:hypothetical protein
MAATVAFVDWMTRHRFGFHGHPFTPSGVGTLQHLDDLTGGPDNHRRNEPGGHAPIPPPGIWWKTMLRPRADQPLQTQRPWQPRRRRLPLFETLFAYEGDMSALLSVVDGASAPMMSDPAARYRGALVMRAQSTLPPPPAPPTGAAGKDLYRVMSIEGHSR